MWDNHWQIKGGIRKMSSLKILLYLSFLLLLCHIIDGTVTSDEVEEEDVVEVETTPIPSKLFPYGLDNVDVNLPRDLDDVSSREIRLQTPIVMYGQQFTSVFVSQNTICDMT
jgi:hypothetical protein